VDEEWKCGVICVDTDSEEIADNRFVEALEQIEQYVPVASAGGKLNRSRYNRSKSKSDPRNLNPTFRSKEKNLELLLYSYL
jgi:hypothetical protein